MNALAGTWPSFSMEEAKAVQNVILSNKVNYWTGNECREFEKEFATWVGAEFAVAVTNGTVALDLALKALGITCGDEVIVTSRTFFASAACIVNAGATPVFADVDVDSQNITAETISAALTPSTKAIICVHLAGWPCDMEPIMTLAKERGLFVIEDCAQAHGARYRGKMVGSIGHIAAWSFCQDKIMTTGGEGGMVTTNSRAWWSSMWSFKDHGKSWDAMYARSHAPGYRWVHDDFGTNWRMLEMQAVIGRMQLRKMPVWTARRRDNAGKIAAVCMRCALVRVPDVPADIEHAFYKFYVFVRPERLADGWTRDRIAYEISEQGVPCTQGSCSELYLEKAFDNTGYRPQYRLQVAKELGETSLMFQVHPSLTENDITRMCHVIEHVLMRADQALLQALQRHAS